MREPAGELDTIQPTGFLAETLGNQPFGHEI